MGRPQKPFTVEVRRGRKGAPSQRPAVASRPLKKRPAPVAAAELEPPPAAPSPAPAPRRILDAIEPPPAPEPVEVAGSTLAEPSLAKPRRGRPPKSATATATAPSAGTVVPRRKPGRPRRVAVQETKVFFEPDAQEIEIATDDVQAVVAPLPLVAKRAANSGPRTQDSGSRAPSAHGHVSHLDRAEAATSLPRGERWKRRVPKVLW